MNRLEKIRSLNDEQLISYLTKVANSSVCDRCDKSFCCAKPDCKGGIRKYFLEEGGKL